MPKSGSRFCVLRPKTPTFGYIWVFVQGKMDMRVGRFQLTAATKSSTDWLRFNRDGALVAEKGLDSENA